MAHIEIVDQTLRDGQQTFWGFRLRAGMVMPVVDHLDRAGYRAVEYAGGAAFEVSLRTCREDPWEAYDLLRSSLKTTPMRSARRASAMGKFGLTPHSMLDLYNRTLVKHGAQSFWIYDCLYNMAELERSCRTVAEAGAQVFPAIMFSDSPVHTDAYFADKVRQYASWGIASGIFVEDAPGILTPSRTATLIPALIEAAQGLPIEFHCHDTLGLATQNYLEAIKHGVTILHTCSRPLATGPSLPSVEMLTTNLEALGHTHDIDRTQLAPIAEQLSRVARSEGFATGNPNEYDARLYLHQLPGGMTGTLKAQLADYGVSESFDAVVHEMAQVRADLGYPVSATPFSQLIGIQALLNVTSGERYKVVPDEVIMYACGHYGETPMPIDGNVKDRILGMPRARELAAWTPPQPTIEEMRKDYGGPDLSDEELILRYLAPIEDIEATRAAGPVRRGYDFSDETSVPALVEEILKSSRAKSVKLRLPSMYIRVSR
jgi:oxaloacetate decarboxylase alpha subunit